MSILRMGLVVPMLAGIAYVTANPPAVPKVVEPATLWETDRSTLFPALKQFVNAPGTKADPKFASVAKQPDGTCSFTKVPAGWFTWKNDKPEGRVVILDKDGFRI